MSPRTEPVVGRRTVLRGMALGLGAGGLLGGCGIPAAKQSADSCLSTDKSSTEKTLIFSNWPSYMDESEEKVNGQTVLPTLNAFEEKSGVKVTYTADVNDNSEFYAKVRDQLGTCQPCGRDIFVLTDWMAARTVGLGWIQKLDHAKIPNVDKNLLKALRGQTWDPNRDYSVPWQTGLTGIAYNAKYTKEVGSFSDLLSRSDLKGKITLLSEMPDTMSFMLRLEGADPNKFNDAEWSKALDRLSGYVGSGQVRRFTGNDYVQDLNAGNIVACEAWSGDVLALQADNPDIKFVVPEEGLGIWSDNMLVPNKATHKANAEALMNYYYDPEVAATLAAWVNYICPVEGAQQAMEKVDPELVESPLIFPDQTVLSKTKAFMPLDTAKAKLYETDFNLAIGGLTTVTSDLVLSGISKQYGAHRAVRELDLTVPQGEFFALLGPSGCGKTTTLRMVAGLEEPSGGTISLGEQDITGLRPYKRPVNTVFQNYALFPHLDIFENVAFGLRRRRVKEVRQKVDEMLELVELGAYGKRKPGQLSGGQQQRVALARALINRPQVLLLDEPLGALDLKLRRQMQIELKRIQTEVGITFVHVTHDQEEAMTMADTIAVMNGGVIEQLGTPTELYDLPATTFVANFLGQSNLVRASIIGQAEQNLVVDVHGSKVTVPIPRCRETEGDVWMGIRPEKVFLAESGTEQNNGTNVLRGAVVTDVSYIGVSTQYLAKLPWGQELTVFEQNTGARDALSVGQPVDLHWQPSHTFVLDAAQDALAGVEDIADDAG